MLEITGVCLYCGQQQMVTANDDCTKEQVDVLVTNKCDCSGALRARGIVEIADRIERLFGRGCADMGFSEECDAHTLQALRQISQMVTECDLDEVKVKLSCGDTAVFRKRDDVAEISREMKRKRTL